MVERAFPERERLIPPSRRRRRKSTLTKEALDMKFRAGQFLCPAQTWQKEKYGEGGF